MQLEKARPHLDPLPQERKPAMAVLGKSLNGESSPALETLLPLPGGEGWGEGEREFQLNRYGLEPRTQTIFGREKTLYRLNWTRIFARTNSLPGRAGPKWKSRSPQPKRCRLLCEAIPGTFSLWQSTGQLRFGRSVEKRMTSISSRFVAF